MFENAAIHRREWADVGKAAAVGTKGDRRYPALPDPDHLLVIAAGGPGRRVRGRDPTVAGSQEPGGDGAGRGVRRLLTGGRPRTPETPDDTIGAIMTHEVLDPTYDDGQAGDESPALAERLDSLDGVTIGIISNGKQGTRRFFDALAAELTETYGAADVVIRVTKSNYSAPADPEILDRAKEEWQAVVAGVGD